MAEVRAGEHPAMGGSAQESRQRECTTVEVIWQTRSFRCDAEPCRKDGFWQRLTAYGAVRVGWGLDLGLVRARKKKKPCGWHLFVVPLMGHVLFGGNNPRANKAARTSRESIAQTASRRYRAMLRPCLS